MWRLGRNHYNPAWGADRGVRCGNVLQVCPAGKISISENCKYFQVYGYWGLFHYFYSRKIDALLYPTKPVWIACWSCNMVLWRRPLFLHTHRNQQILFEEDNGAGITAFLWSAWNTMKKEEGWDGSRKKTSISGGSTVCNSYGRGCRRL